MRLGGLADRLYGSAVPLLCLAVLGWSGNFIVGRLVHDSIPPATLAFLRWLTAFLVLLPFGWAGLRQDRGTLLRHRWMVLLLSISGVAAYNTLIYTGLGTTTAVNALLMQSVMPLLIVVFAFALFRERPNAGQLAGLAVSLAGVWLVVTRGHPFGSGGLRLGQGDAWVFVAVVSYAFYTALLRRRPRVGPLSLLTVTFGIGALMLLPLAAAEAATGHVVHVTPGAVVAVAYVALIPSILSYFCYNRGVELTGGAHAGQFLHLMPVFGAVLAFFTLGERIQGFHLAAAAVIAAGIVLATVRRTGRATGHPAASHSTG
ncbi:DMT family transporter [Streptosporangium sp. NPDC051022]|uniref:DMT family transporter n=1 Tax=Streptosporangium sp. NPDC051022 TaxID=3155752 RepID=UPI0034390231